MQTERELNPLEMQHDAYAGLIVMLRIGIQLGVYVVRFPAEGHPWIQKPIDASASLQGKSVLAGVCHLRVHVRHAH